MDFYGKTLKNMPKRTSNEGRAKNNFLIKLLISYSKLYQFPLQILAYLQP